MSTTVSERGLCEICQARPRAINYKKNGKTYYRSKCNTCLKGTYINAFVCAMCGFRARYPEQLVPVSEEKANKSVCLNCDITRQKERAKLDKKLKPIADD